MDFTKFIANRLRGASQNHSFSKLIIRLCIASIAIGVAVMIIASSMIRGFKSQISHKIFDFWGHIHITESFIQESFNPEPIEYDPAIVDSILNINELEYDLPRTIPGLPFNFGVKRKRTKGVVHRVQRFIQFPGIISTESDFEGIFIKGVGTDYDRQFFEQYIIDGNQLELSDSTIQRGIVLSKITANRLLLNVGDFIRIHLVLGERQIQRRLKVEGIYSTGLAEYDKKVAFVDIAFLQQTLRWQPNQIGGLEVVLEHISDIDLYNAYIYQEILPQDQYTQSIKQKFNSIFDWLELQNINERLIIGLMLVVCMINLITTVLILILERTRLIGILRALGAQFWSIRIIFLRQGASILGIGLLLGNFIGIGISLLQQRFGIIKLKEEDYYLSVAPIELSLPAIFLINLLTLLVTIAVLIGPTYFIKKLSVVKAIRVT